MSEPGDGKDKADKELGETKAKASHEARSALEALIFDGIEEGLQLAFYRLCASGIDPIEARRILGLE